MSLHSLRKQSWLRTAIAVLVLCFALGSIAHAGHSHEQKNTGVHVVCDYCVSFSGLIDAPLPTALVDAAQFITVTLAIPATGFIATRPVGTAQARAPPSL